MIVPRTPSPLKFVFFMRPSPALPSSWLPCSSSKSSIYHCRTRPIFPIYIFCRKSFFACSMADGRNPATRESLTCSQSPSQRKSHHRVTWKEVKPGCRTHHNRHLSALAHGRKSTASSPAVLIANFASAGHL